MKRPFKSSVCYALLAVLATIAQSVSLHANEAREWTSSDGRSLNATVIQIDSKQKTIHLARSSDGQTFTLDWKRLSPADREWIKDTLEAQHNKPPSTSKQKITLAELPESFELDDVPMVKQKNNYCVPASATMIAGFHGLETDQDQVAKLSSGASEGNRGTYPSDMLLAMEKLGFKGNSLNWEAETFNTAAMPLIRRALIESGPIYISFKPGVFGTMGHGCVIIGYDDRRREMTFHNPWGNVFVKTYDLVAVEGYGVVFIDPPTVAPIASDRFIAEIQTKIHAFDGDFLKLTQDLNQANVPNELVWCSRRDSRDDQRFAKDTARRDGRTILELAFRRNPAVLIPYSPKGETTAYYFVTRPPEGGASFMVREITAGGWSEPELKTLGSLTRYWTTRFTVPDQADPVWELPMIELRTR
jgi:hypothetical protein